MKISELIHILEQLAPPSLQEKYDNSGLLTGNADAEINGLIVCLDSTEEVLDEAISSGANVVVAHHPILFSGLKSLTGKNYVERIIIKAIQHNIAIYALHTNLDNVKHGVNNRIADKLDLTGRKVLQPATGKLCKLVTFAPETDATRVRNALFNAGAGNISNYSECSFNVTGTGTFKAGEEANPTVGRTGSLHFEKEERIEVISDTYLINKVINALKANHPYEEVAYDIYPLLNQHNYTGAGLIGELPAAVPVLDFLKLLKERMLTSCIRHTRLIKDQIRTVAVCGGSGSFLLDAALKQRADIFITADFKYHQFFDADGQIIIADIGHYESEQFTSELIADYLKDKIATFAVRLTKVNTNPVNYL